MQIAQPVDLIAINKQNQILLCRRSEDDFGYENTWSFPGGDMIDDEKAEDALRREIKEELGCRVGWCKIFKTYRVKLNNDFVAVATYLYGEIEGSIALNKELSEYRWFGLEDSAIFKLRFAFNQKTVLQEFLVFHRDSNTSPLLQP